MSGQEARSVQSQRASGRSRVLIETPMGAITVALHNDQAPKTCENFLHYVENHLYDGGSFYRAMRAEHASPSRRFQLVQGGLWPLLLDRTRPPIALEATSTTGLRHLDGTLSMARHGRDSAQAEFVICIDDCPQLDGDGSDAEPGFAAFAQVIDGMEVVRRIQAMPTHQEAPIELLRGQLLEQPVPFLSVRRV